jgi:surface antigen
MTMRNVITLMSIILGISFVFALANAEDSTKESSYESSHSTSKLMPGTKGSTEATLSEATPPDTKTCTDSSGVVHSSSDKQAYQECQKGVKKRAGEMGGQFSPSARPSSSPES